MLGEKMFGKNFFFEKLNDTYFYYIYFQRVMDNIKHILH